jgi:hypothetical protein
MTSDANKTTLRHGVAEWLSLFIHALAALGFVSGAAFVAYIGKLYAAALLLFLAFLCSLRLKRGRVSK